MWDIQTASGMTLQNARSLIDTYAKKTGTTLDTILDNIKKLDTNRITTESRLMYEKLFK